MKRPDFNIVFVGAGNVASCLAPALMQKGCRIVQVYSRTQESAQTLARKADCPYTTDLTQISGEADLYIVSVKDDVLDDVTARLACSGNPDALYAHTAGSMPMDVWKGKIRRYGVLYPMQTFSKACLLKEVAGRVSPKIYEASSEQRRYLHIAAVFACNFTNHMYTLCDRLLAAHGLPFESMLPLIDETARKIHELPPLEAQTGPARRNDRNVIGRHLDILKKEAPELADLYGMISRSIHTYELNNKMTSK